MPSSRRAEMATWDISMLQLVRGVEQRLTEHLEGGEVCECVCVS